MTKATNTMINFFDVGSLKAENATQAYEQSEALIAEYMAILEKGYCMQQGLSCGKDSSTTFNASVEAMRRAIEQGIIEPDHPLVAITVDTLLEPEPIQSYVPFAHEMIKARCREIGVKLHIEIVSPPIDKHLMVLYAGAQKLPATSASGRHADCSIIWKVDVSIDALKRIKKSLPKKYQDAVWVSVSGSRTEESTRRANNMGKQGVRDLRATNLIEQVEADGLSSTGNVYKFAPIYDWTSKEVINYLNHAGTDPIAKTAIDKRIASYGDNFGLLLAIYGEGSNEVCEVVAIDNQKKAEQKGCGKIARFGCVTCGMTSEDHSSIELKQYLRWGRFGDATQRLRDYIVRISSDVDHRAYHARAYDPAANNNVFMQPNTLKAKTLEKMLWYAAQITEDSRAVHQEFTARYQAGDIDNDPGVLDIMGDTSLSMNVRVQYKEMYITRVLEKPMFEIFTEEHAVLLSLLWSLHGVATLPYRPVKILDQVKKGIRIPYPLTNAELNRKLAAQGRPAWNDKTVLNSTIPDALVAQVFTPAKRSFSALKAEHGDNLGAEHLQDFMPFSVCELWENKHIQFDALGSTINFPTTRAKHTRTFKLQYQIDLATNVETVKAKDQATGRQMSLPVGSPTHKVLLELAREDYYKATDVEAIDAGMFVEELLELRQESKGTFGIESTHAFNNQKVFTSDVQFVEAKLRSRSDNGKHFSARKREFNKSTGKHDIGRASLRVYTPKVTPLLAGQAEYNVQYWLPDSAVTRQCRIDVHDADYLSEEECKESFVFDNDIYPIWLKGHWDMMVATHDNQVRSNRASGLLRRYSGTTSVYYLTTNSGLTCTQGFEKYMLKTLRRTETFDKAGLFSIAACTHAQIAQHSGIVSMTTHRQQKVQHLLAMRYLRNQRRASIKAQIAEHGLSPSVVARRAVSNVSVRLTEFITQYKGIAKEYLSAALMANFFDDCSYRTDNFGLWLSEHQHVTRNIDGVLSLLAIKQERDIINNDYDSKALITRLFMDKMAVLKNELEDFSGDYAAKTGDLWAEANSEIPMPLAVVDYHYEATGDLATRLEALAKKVAENLPRHNVFLIQNGFTICLSRIARLDYVCPSMGHYDSANTLEKKDRRETTSRDVWQGTQQSVLLATHSVFDDLTACAQTQQPAQHQLLSSMTVKAKSDKLSSLIGGTDMLAALRAKTAQKSRAGARA
jgi:3'-phosphoadenosine 5'-phosphosulfate sulfotransferase (PAPS reductase)/FAD synthetase